MARYICDSCEDYEEINLCDFVEGMHCVCGGHLHLERHDNYVEIKEKCNKCENRDSIKCFTCTRSKNNFIRKEKIAFRIQGGSIEVFEEFEKARKEIANEKRSK